jgi:hypothetical protein
LRPGANGLKSSRMRRDERSRVVYGTVTAAPPTCPHRVADAPSPDGGRGWGGW